MLHSLAPFIKNITDVVKKKFKDKLVLKKFDVRDLAINGYATFPVERLCGNEFDNDMLAEAVSYVKSTEE